MGAINRAHVGLPGVWLRNMNNNNELKNTRLLSEFCVTHTLIYGFGVLVVQYYSMHGDQLSDDESGIRWDKTNHQLNQHSTKWNSELSYEDTHLCRWSK